MNGMSEKEEREQRNHEAFLVADFMEWSGGFTPDECEPSEIAAYIKHARPNWMTRKQAREILTNYGK